MYNSRKPVAQWLSSSRRHENERIFPFPKCYQEPFACTCDWNLNQPERTERTISLCIGRNPSNLNLFFNTWSTSSPHISSASASRCELTLNYVPTWTCSPAFFVLTGRSVRAVASEVGEGVPAEELDDFGFTTIKSSMALCRMVSVWFGETWVKW